MAGPVATSIKAGKIRSENSVRRIASPSLDGVGLAIGSATVEATVGRLRFVAPRSWASCAAVSFAVQAARGAAATFSHRSILLTTYNSLVAPLGALSQAWTSAEAALPHGWQLSGVYHFNELWIALAEGAEFDDYLSGSGQYAEQALRNLAWRLAERRGKAWGES